MASCDQCVCALLAPPHSLHETAAAHICPPTHPSMPTYFGVASAVPCARALSTAAGGWSLAHRGWSWQGRLVSAWVAGQACKQHGSQSRRGWSGSGWPMVGICQGLAWPLGDRQLSTNCKPAHLHDTHDQSAWRLHLRGPFCRTRPAPCHWAVPDQRLAPPAAAQCECDGLCGKTCLLRCTLDFELSQRMTCAPYYCT